MNTDNMDWDQHYKKILNLSNFDAYKKYDIKNPYIARLLKYSKDKKCSLEFGSGKGSLSLIQKRNYSDLETHLLDLEDNAINFSKKLFKYFDLEAYFYKHDFMNLPFPDQKFDIIHGNTVLEHVEKTEDAIKEFLRVLKNNGHILVTVPNSFRKFDGHDLYHTINRFNYFSRTFFPKELEKIFLDNSCEIIERFGTGCIYHYPSYLPRYIAEKIRKKRSKEEKERNHETDNLSIYSSKERTFYKSTFSIFDNFWDPIQKKINLYTSRNQTFPYSWYITIGFVVKKID